MSNFSLGRMSASDELELSVFADREDHYGSLGEIGSAYVAPRPGPLLAYKRAS